jgi:hypothetical protein
MLFVLVHCYVDLVIHSLDSTFCLMAGHIIYNERMCVEWELYDVHWVQ